MSTVIYKQLATKQDLAIGKGKVTQTRNGVEVELDEIDFVSISAGVESWNSQSTYEVGSLTRGSDNLLYQGLLVNTGEDPVSDDGTNWRQRLFSNLPIFSSTTDFVNRKPIDGNNGDVKLANGMVAAVITGASYKLYSIRNTGALPDIDLGSGLWGKSQVITNREVLNVLGQDPIRSAKGGIVNTLVFNWNYDRKNIIILGDSITAGVGATNPIFTYASCLGMALSRHLDQGYSYPVHQNSTNAAKVFMSDGTIITTGLSLSAIRLGVSDTLTLTPSEGIGAFVTYDGAQSTATSIELHVNGAVVASTAVLGDTLEDAFLLRDSKSWTAADTVTVKAIGGDLIVFGAAPAKRSLGTGNSSPLVITNGASGKSFEFYRSNISKVSKLLTAYSGGTPSVVVLALGTNSIYNATETQTPTEYAASMIGLANEIKTANSSEIIFTIPPRAVETTWPVINSAYSYEDYVDAIKTAAISNSSDLIDLNIRNISYADGVHPDDKGHIALAKHYCDFFGIEPRFESPELLYTRKLTPNSPALLPNGYGYINKHGTVSLTGTLQPNGLGTNLLLTLPEAFWPTTQKRFIVPLTPDGFGHVTISSIGEVRMDYNSVTWTTVEFDGITY